MNFLTTIYQTSSYNKKIQQIDNAGKNVLSSILFQKTILFFVTLSPYTLDWCYIKVPMYFKWVYHYQQITSILQYEFKNTSKNRFVFMEKSIYIFLRLFSAHLYSIALLPNPHQKSSSFSKCSTWIDMHKRSYFSRHANWSRTTGIRRTPSCRSRCCSTSFTCPLRFSCVCGWEVVLVFSWCLGRGANEPTEPASSTIRSTTISNTTF